MNQPDSAPAGQDDSITAERPARLLQFRLRSMFVLTFVVALVCSLLFSMPPTASLPLLLAFSVMLPAVLTTIIVYGRSYQRTFCIGAMFPAGPVLMSLCFFLFIFFLDPGNFDSYMTRLATDNNWLWLRVVVGSLWLFSVAAGLLCMGVRRLVEERPTRR